MSRFVFWKLRTMDKLESGRCRDKLGAASNCLNSLKWDRILDGALSQAFWRAVLHEDWPSPDCCLPPDLRGMLKETDICEELEKVTDRNVGQKWQVEGLDTRF